ncbi:MAG: tRNA-uridine aminocarboxypropyltransferase [Bacteriovoracales bacterium]
MLRKKSTLPTPVSPKRCTKCLRSIKSCFCSAIEPFPTNTDFRILMHPKEAKRQKVGTGRIANLCLENSKIIIGEQFQNNLEVNNLINSPHFHTLILYPGETSHNITQGPITFDPNKKLLVFIIDGTWPCAKSMMRDSKNLHHLPRISFETNEISKFKIKHQPAKYCLSTIESIYHLLNGLEKWNLEQLEGKQKILPQALERIVDFQLKCAIDPKLSGYRRGAFSDPSKRKDSIKWESRKICFDEKNYLHRIKPSLQVQNGQNSQSPTIPNR